ncbi:MAG: hypothetical protein ABIE94_00315 [archaeon]
MVKKRGGEAPLPRYTRGAALNKAASPSYKYKLTKSTRAGVEEWEKDPNQDPNKLMHQITASAVAREFGWVIIEDE